MHIIQLGAGGIHHHHHHHTIPSSRFIHQNLPSHPHIKHLSRSHVQNSFTSTCIHEDGRTCTNSQGHNLRAWGVLSSLQRSWGNEMGESRRVHPKRVLAKDEQRGVGIRIGIRKALSREGDAEEPLAQSIKSCSSTNHTLKWKEKKGHFSPPHQLLLSSHAIVSLLSQFLCFSLAHFRIPLDIVAIACFILLHPASFQDQIATLLLLMPAPETHFLGTGLLIVFLIGFRR